MAEERGGARRLHAHGIPAKQRAHFAALLILAIALPLQGRSDIEFDPAITTEEFAEFSRLVAQGIYATPVEPARAAGLLGFGIGVAVTAVPVDTSAPYWTRSVADDFSVSGYVGVPRLVVTKGLSSATISGSYSKVQDTDITIWGGSLDIPVVRGSVVAPELALRGSYATVRGLEELDLKTYGVELFLSKGFGPVMPYIAAGRARSDAEGHIVLPDANTIVLTDQADSNRFTVGLRLSLLLPKIVIEATQAEERSYAAKVSFGL